MPVFREKTLLFEEKGAPNALRLLFGAVALPLLGIGLFGFVSLGRAMLSSPAVPVTGGGLVLGLFLSTAFTLVALGLLYGALGPAARTIRFDAIARRVFVTGHYPFGAVRRKSFAFEELERPTVDYVAGDSESSPGYFVTLRFPGGSPLRHCEVLLPLDRQKAFAEDCARRISDMMAVLR